MPCPSPVYRIQPIHHHPPLNDISSGSDTFPCNTMISTLLLLLLLSSIPLADGLTCMTCLHSTGTTQLDNFRVSTRLTRPICPLEPIRCDRDQDVCVTITMHIGGGEYWLGAGCDRRINFQHMSCQNVRTVSRNVQLGFVQERRAMQRVCVCARDLCNSSTLHIHYSVYLIPLLCYLLFASR